jgi:ATP-dependent RNA helicase RhlE
MSFAELGVAAPILEMLRKREFAAPFPIQKLVIPDALAGRDVLAKSRTGSGKTLAFAIPIAQLVDPQKPKPSALILVPTRELAVQVAEELRIVSQPKGIRVASVYGGVSLDKQAQRAGKAHVVIATPGRLTDLVNRRLLSLKAVEILVLDEADRMLDMGFKPQVDRIVTMLPKQRQTMFFSATLDGVVGSIARAYTNDAALHEIKESQPTVELADHRFIPVGEHDKLDKLVEVLGDGERSLALIFVRTKRGADRLVSRLKTRKIHAEAMHGDMTQAARQRAIDRFASGRSDVLVATDVAARGLDLDGITHVINYDPPQDHKDYLHRVGRTARAGRTGAGITFVAPVQRSDVSAIARQLDLKEEFESEGMQLSAPALVYSSGGKRSMLRSRPKRRF